MLSIAIPLAIGVIVEHGAVTSDAFGCEVCLVQADAICAIISEVVGDDRGVTLCSVYHLHHALDVCLLPARVVRWVTTAFARCAVV